MGMLIVGFCAGGFAIMLWAIVSNHLMTKQHFECLTCKDDKSKWWIEAIERLQQENLTLKKENTQMLNEVMVARDKCSREYSFVSDKLVNRNQA